MAARFGVARSTLYRAVLNPAALPSILTEVPATLHCAVSNWPQSGARVAPCAVGSAWKPALDKVWEFIRSQPGLRTDGHNMFLYHPSQPGAQILCDFGVEVTRTFETAGEVHATETPGGEAAVAVHRGPYNRMNEPAGHSWEIYGDPTPNPADTETTVVYLLK
jgi:hypothetical protein